MHTRDTITALSTPAGPGARAIVRISGPAAAAAFAPLFVASQPLVAGQRALLSGHLRLPELAPIPAEVYFWAAPHSYTGQDLAEIHLLSSPPLVELLIARLLQSGCRAAQPGEFTLRAFLAGKLDLTRAEAVHAVIESGSRDELKQALKQLGGGMARPLQELRDDLLNLLADVEAGLDFADEDIRFVQPEEMLRRLGKALAQVTLLGKQLEQRGLTERVFRVVLTGRPNAGKSSLFNALTGADALVSSQPGTTRDYLVQRLRLGEIHIELIDTPGWQPDIGTIETQAQTLACEQAEQADLLLLCLEAGHPVAPEEEAMCRRPHPPVVAIATKCDLATPHSGMTATSAVTGSGIASLRSLLAEYAHRHKQAALAPSLSRCRHHVASCLEQLRRAHSIVLFEEPPELLALELRGALEQLGEMVGTVYTDDLLDRIFSRFCIGK
ncbi:MAG TPA: tRNA modification GTPase [Gemmataceae bacterium]|nr:tRNA modification GTPase [Gemmataceae bacterium]